MSVKRWARSAASYLPERLSGRAQRARRRSAGIRPQTHRVDDLALRGFKRPNPVIVHAGTDIAASAASIRRMVGHSQIHGFEANPRLHDLLRLHDITVHGELLSAATGSVELHVPRYGSTSFDVDASLDHTTAAMFLGEDRFAGYKPERAAVDTLVAATATLDSFNLAPDIVVLDGNRDAEGALRGALETLSHHRPLIRLDGDPAEAIGIVEGLGYVPARYDPGAACVVLEQPGVEITWLVHGHHRGLLRTPVV